MGHGLNLPLVLIFIFFVKLEEKCIFGANVTDFEIFKTVVVIRFWKPIIAVDIARCAIPP